MSGPRLTKINSEYAHKSAKRIAKLRGYGMSLGDLSKRFGVSPWMISDIVKKVRNGNAQQSH